MAPASVRVKFMFRCRRQPRSGGKPGERNGGQRHKEAGDGKSLNKLRPCGSAEIHTRPTSVRASKTDGVHTKLNVTSLRISSLCAKRPIIGDKITGIMPTGRRQTRPRRCGIAAHLCKAAAEQWRRNRAYRQG